MSILSKIFNGLKLARNSKMNEKNKSSKSKAISRLRWVTKLDRESML